MSILKANQILDTSGVVRGTPINIKTISLPLALGGVATGYVDQLSQFTTSNTALLTEFIYNPVSSSSYVVYQGMFDVDANGVSYNEHLVIFINGVPYSNAYFYRRNANNEPMSKSQAGVYTNTTGQPLVFQVRGCNSNGSTMCIGKSNQGAVGGSSSMSNTITIFEVQK